MMKSTDGREVFLFESEVGSKILSQSTPSEKEWCLMMHWTMLEWISHDLSRPCLLLKMVEVGEVVVVMELVHREVEEM